MRFPIRNETDAFTVTFGGAVISGGAVAVGSLVDPLAGVALLIGALAGAVIWHVSRRDPDRLQGLRAAAAQAPRPSSAAPHRVLVVANRTLHGDQLRAELGNRAADGAEVRIVAPILPSRVHYFASDVDRELEEARDRLASALAWAGAGGVTATGRVGDPYEAFAAIEDELRFQAVDEVIISTYPAGKSNWLETGIVERLRSELDIPVTHVVVTPDRVGQAAAS